MRDCFFLVADRDMQFAVKGLLERPEFHQALGCAAFEFNMSSDSLVAGNHDPDLYQRSANYARPIAATHRHLVVMLDEAWDGSPGAKIIAEKIEQDLDRNGWNRHHFAVIVISPELEAWLWQESPWVSKILGFDEKVFSIGDLRGWLSARGLWSTGQAKPDQPKRALLATLAKASTPRSSRIFEKIARRASLSRCSDPAFERLLYHLRRWFPAR